MKKNSLYYSKAVKIRFRSWIYMKPPFGKTIDNVIYWRGWEKADDFLEENVGAMKYLIELPLAFVALIAVITNYLRNHQEQRPHSMAAF